MSDIARIESADIADLARGAAILGTGGGGDPYIGQLMAWEALETSGPVELVAPADLPDQAQILPVAMMGAPTVMIEKLPSVDQFVVAVEALGQYLGVQPTHIACMEAGGVNSTIPIVAAAQMGLPLLDGDFMGRAFPELQMVTATLFDIPATPMSITDDKGNAGIFNTVSNLWAERLARVATVEMGAAAIVSLYPMRGDQAKASAVVGTLSLCVRLGRAVRQARAVHNDPVAAVAEVLGGRLIHTGKVVDVVRRTTAGFARGEAKLAGLEHDAGTTLTLNFQNEHIIATRQGVVLATAPDLLICLDVDTGEPITTESMRFGHRIALLAAPCDSRWQTPEGIALVGPRYFGYDTDPVRWNQVSL
ncbi:MAG: DUF917 domain-containing protein [Propionibacteriaceae bacterium]|jgi:DUF917 family protein|nr:DUF917 domain-containing protein [Propionibacteriaceae bacterium]